MANVKLVFSGTERSGTEESELQLYHTAHNEILVEINDLDSEPSIICLDRLTAIRLHKELKKQISYFREEDVK